MPCAACLGLAGKGPCSPKHPRLDLMQRWRPDAGLALYFRCRTCACELRCVTDPKASQRGWRMHSSDDDTLLRTGPVWAGAQHGGRTDVVRAAPRSG